MGTGSSQTSSPQSGVDVIGRTGTCRLCFEKGGSELIAPCSCKGSSQWIHRDCLNRWRTAGSNPRSLTNCCECGFQYNLQLHRIVDSEGEARQRRFMRRVAGQGIGCLLGTQLIIVLLGLSIRLLDKNEWLVSLFNFPQDPGQVGFVGNFANVLMHHKMTYYVSGVIALLFLLGVAVIFNMIWIATRSLCSGSRQREACCLECCRVCCEPRLQYGYNSYHSGFYCGNMCGDCVECGLSCAQCCCQGGTGQHICDSRDCARNCPNMSNVGGGGGHSNDNPLITVLLIVVIAFVIIGLFAACVALVTAVQRAATKLAQIQQVRVLAQEYVVQDLASPEDLGDGSDGNTMQCPSAPPAPPSLNTKDQLEIQMQISKDIACIFGGQPDSSQALHGYQGGGYGSQS